MEVILGFVVFVGLLTWWAYAAQTRRRAREAEDAARAVQLRDALALRFVTRPFDRALYRLKVADSGLRALQIVGESLSLIDSSKNGGTRESRLQTIQSEIAWLDEQAWCGLPDEVRQAAHQAAARAAQVVIVKAADDELQKHVRAINRATRDETKLRYFDLAIDALARAQGRVTDADLLQSLEACIAQAREQRTPVEGSIAARVAPKESPR